ncbi:MAG TPA: KTSC domain-containing protein [Kiritimatiellia bacterium]|jgi:hypothetical protein|nr:KTSC domain-containing protein [Kiritimatiellia bacterium]OQC59143.1 MAG: hypothetical protein BWX54_00761 [Verrucomicrobia bacterium ADurb.Bin018]MBP9572494.1 KTSC domain-containing protein [Kiritimatiellia bacterium]HOE01214.1 KTSC domain-containing protein [Kiritimatiellia bacterium]HOE37775.1 KTSC domain-containing protein [Kiritimatiellia bacterium]
MKKLAVFLAALFVLSAAAWALDIEMQAVESSLIAKVGYSADAKELVVQMHNSSDIYVYKGVPQAVYDDFLAADSKGAFYVKNIKGQYETERK